MKKIFAIIAILAIVAGLLLWADYESRKNLGVLAAEKIGQCEGEALIEALATAQRRNLSASETQELLLRLTSLRLETEARELDRAGDSRSRELARVLRRASDYFAERAGK